MSKITLYSSTFILLSIIALGIGYLNQSPSVVAPNQPLQSNNIEQTKQDEDMDLCQSCRLLDGTESYPLSLVHPAAPFLESRAYAISQGATDEWHKLEGLAFDEIDDKLYIAVSVIDDEMGRSGGDIHVPQNLCGAIYVADLDKNYEITEIRPLILGGPYDETKGHNSCDADNIANPDNLAVDAFGNLWIGEDSHFHENNMLWMWDGSNLKRFATLPHGAEIAGLHINLQGTLFMNVQRPINIQLPPFTQSTIGVITQFQAGDDFVPVALPHGNAKQSVVLGAGHYQILGRVGDAIPDSVNGDLLGQLEMSKGLSTLCDRPDGNGFIPLDERGEEGYLYTNFECAPGLMTKQHLRQTESGAWHVLSHTKVDTSSIRGLWLGCSSAITTWGTLLFNEEHAFEIDTPKVDDLEAMSLYLGHPANLYHYGFVGELRSGQSADEMVKQYVLGRFSHEISLVMPNRRTVYMSNDTTNAVLFKFVADQPQKLSSGTLYAAKVQQFNEQGKITFRLEWIELGHASNDEVEQVIQALDRLKINGF